MRKMLVCPELVTCQTNRHHLFYETVKSTGVVKKSTVIMKLWPQAYVIRFAVITIIE